MISFLRGRLSYKGLQSVVVDVNGIGFEATMATRSIESLGPVGEEVTILTSMQVKDDGISLYGFADDQERVLFSKLIGVSGLGPKGAISALSSYDSPKLMKMIGAGDIAGISKVPGIGKKTAQRIVVDLQSAYAQYAQANLLDEGDEEDEAPGTTSLSESMQALLSMGFTREESELALKGYTGPDDVSEIVRYALKRLGGF